MYGGCTFISCRVSFRSCDKGVCHSLAGTIWPLGQLSSYQYTLASSRRLQRCTRILGARRVNETASLTGSREMLVLWLRHEVLETCARGKAGDKRAARRSSPRMYRQKRENSALAARHCATATAVKKRIASEENTISCSQTDPTMVGWFSGSSGVCWYVAKKELACAEHAARSLANM